MKTVEIQCCVAGCGHSPFPMAESFYERARRTHEFWHCPAGHAQHFTGESEEERLSREVKTLRRQLATVRELYERADALARKCPWPGCRSYVYSSRDSMYDHLRRTHGMPVVAEIQEEAS